MSLGAVVESHDTSFLNPTTSNEEREAPTRNAKPSILWHIVVYTDGFEYESARPYTVHIFTDKKLSLEEAFSLAEEILTKTFPNWNEDNERLAYIGYENIPVDINIDGFYYVVAKFEIQAYVLFDDFSFKVEGVVSNVPHELASAIEEYRKRFITLDCDYIYYYDEEYDYDYECDENCVRACVIDALDRLSELGYMNTKIFKTRRGYHIRAELPSPMPLEKILEIREELGDDYARIFIDKEYLQKQLGFLTNMLFNLKCIKTDNTFSCYEESEIDASLITTVRNARLSMPLPEMKIELPKGTVEFDRKGYVTFVGRFSERDVENIMKGINDILREYEHAKETFKMSDEDIKAKIVKAYEKISSTHAIIAERCVVRVEDGTVVMYVPEYFSEEYVDMLIGRHGDNIRAVEAELGMRIRIEMTRPPPYGLKRKLQEFFKKLNCGTLSYA
ncbi:MAG: hypothetical protein QXM08_03635 [Thermofilaceae archaeon]